MLSSWASRLAMAGLVSAVLWALFPAQALRAQTATNLICNGCVGASDIANGAVRSGEIANSTIVSSDIKDGAINSQDIRNNAITGAKILNGTVTSVDMAPSLNLGTQGNDGDFTVKNASGTPTVRMNGDGANITNLFSSVPGQSNGLVKAWARVESTGAVHSCWRCNTDPTVTFRDDTGIFFVDFTPLATDISARPIAVVNRSNSTGAVQNEQVTLVSVDNDLSRVFVITHRSTNGDLADYDFTVFIF